MPIYFAYCRKSTEAEDRQVLSIDSQHDEMQRLAEREGLASLEFLSEARTAKARGRPIFNAMIKRLKRHEAVGILCWKLDRLARNPFDGAEIISLLKEPGIHIITPTQRFRPGDNIIQLYLEFGIAHQYVDDLSRNVKRGNLAKLERGGWPGRTPGGYLNDRLNKTVLSDPERFPLLQQAWRLLLTGHLSVQRLRRMLNNELGYRTRTGGPLSLNALYAIFRNPFYYAVMERKEGRFLGTHQPMITEADFWLAQQLLGERGRPRPRRYSFPYTGLIRCGECGCMVTAENKVNRYGYRYTYYHCTRKRPCRQRVVEAKRLEAQILDFLGELELSPTMLNWAVEELDADAATHAAQQTALQEGRTKAITRLHDEVRELRRLRTRGLISDEEFAEDRKQLQTELVQLEGSAEGASAADADVATVAAFIFAARARDWFLAAGPPTRREILAAIGSNLMLTDKILSIDALPPLRAIAERARAKNGQIVRIEPRNRLGFTGLESRIPHQKSIMCALVGEVRTFMTTSPDASDFLAKIRKFFRENRFGEAA